jgi:hypothetical protein
MWEARKDSQADMAVVAVGRLIADLAAYPIYDAISAPSIQKGKQISPMSW